jgi:hypothetical protein
MSPDAAARLSSGQPCAHATSRSTSSWTPATLPLASWGRLFVQCLYASSLAQRSLAGEGTIQRRLNRPSHEPNSQWFTLTDDGSAAVTIPFESDDLATVDLASGAAMKPIDTRHLAAFAVLPTGDTTVIAGGADRASYRP